MTEDVVIDIPPKLMPVFEPERGEVRYRCAKGGRGSGKSMTFAKMAALFGAIEPLRILCTRDIQNSIRESFHAELKAAIASVPFLRDHYDVGVDYIRGDNGTEFVFKGLRTNMESIKSMAQIDICIIEEAEDVPERSWIDLEPTIRAPKSEIWVVWNPKIDGSPVDLRFVKNQPPRCTMATVNHNDNPWFPFVLDEQRRHHREVYPPEKYAHIWEGAYLSIGEASIFMGKWDVREFEPGADWDGAYFGLDFGFAKDPTACVKLWVFSGCLYVEYEFGGVGIELDDTARLLIEHMPGIASHSVRADNARPESISLLRRTGLPGITPCSKGKGSVEDGITHLQNYKRIVIHPRCTAVIDEFRNYSYKIDRLSGQVLPVILDEHNHYIDAIRYALEPLMRGSHANVLDYMTTLLAGSSGR